MATSGTTSFDLNIDEIIDEGYERCGLSTNAGYDLRSARRSLNLLFAEWGNRGIHLWKVTLNTIALVEGQAEYSTATNTNDVLEAFVSTTSANTGERTDVSLTKIDRSAYAALPNKGAKGQPSQYYVQRFIDKVTITLYLTPGSSQAGDKINYYFVKRIQDIGDYTNATDVPYRFVPCMVSGLAFYLSQKFKPELSQQMKLYYEDELQRALAEDGSSSSSYITPKTYYPNV